MSLTTVDVAPFLSKSLALWREDGIRGLFPLELRPGMISLLAGEPPDSSLPPSRSRDATPPSGRPNASTFPFESITLKLRSTLAGLPAQADGIDDMFTIELGPEDLAQGLQYGPTAGSHGLREWFENFQAQVHKRPQNGTWTVCVGSGSQDLLCKACCNSDELILMLTAQQAAQLLVDAGDSILVETPAYPGSLNFFRTLPVSLIEVNSDGQGLDPDHLSSILSTWDSTYPGRPMPKFLYTIPSGSNPTGASIPEARKVQILRLAKQYNFLILEDDAYAFVYYGEGPRARTYFEMETEVSGEEGRVVRFDSFSKVMSSGMRIGFMTASPELARAVNLVTASTNLQPNSLTQLMAYSLLVRWGPEGFLEHCRGVAQFYRARRDMFEALVRKHLDGLVEWTSPIAGMFLYLRLLIPTPDGTPLDSKVLVSTHAVEKGVLAVPGSSFMPLGGPTPFLRISFSIIEEDKAEEACKRLREVILEARKEAQS
ncbi:unnamed protein product [Mycena citricolor]|uniref:Aminotransferase class I/classII large domain-containing protein n=1 Tax=Mycena citricolor TaxID=2018698 RepID=A0AAD2HJ68_9AGAR|nr:unnamed protein product [Mycena citricolor]